MSVTPLARTWRRWWWVVVILGVLGLAAGGAVGVKRTPVFTSSAVVSVGPLISVNSSASTTNADLAADYTEVTKTTSFEHRVASLLHSDIGYVAANLSASNTVGTQLITLTGKGSSAVLAEHLVSSAALALRREFSSRPATNGSNQSLLKQYGAATVTQQKLQRNVARLAAAPDTPPKLLQRANVALAVARLRTQALAAAFSASTQATGLGTDARPRVVTAATAASSDRKKKTVEFAAVGLIVGLCLGASVLTLAGAGTPHAERDRRTDDATLEKV